MNIGKFVIIKLIGNDMSIIVSLMFDDEIELVICISDGRELFLGKYLNDEYELDFLSFNEVKVLVFRKLVLSLFEFLCFNFIEFNLLFSSSRF